MEKDLSESDNGICDLNSMDMKTIKMTEELIDELNDFIEKLWLNTSQPQTENQNTHTDN